MNTNVKQTEQAQVTLEKFLNAWKFGNYEQMSKNAQITWLNNQIKPVDILGLLFQHRKLKRWEIKDSHKEAEARISFKVALKYMVENRHVNNKIRIQLICEIAPYKADVIDGRWGVNPISALG